MFSERTSKILMWIGIALFLCGIIFFIWNDKIFLTSVEINSKKFGEFGSFIGGLIGTLWAFAGVILFYVALQEQRMDSKKNQEILSTQAKALEQQISEFQKQTAEARLTRDVFLEQSKTLKLQQFESTFYNTLNLFINLTENITYVNISTGKMGVLKKERIRGRESFAYLYSELEDEFKKIYGKYVTENLKETFEYGKDFKVSQDKHLELVIEAYELFFNRRQSVLGNYFRTMYNIIRFVNDSKIDNAKYYTNMVRAQISSYEHILLFYNCISKYGKDKFYPLINTFSILDNMPKDLLFDKAHLGFYSDEAYK